MPSRLTSTTGINCKAPKTTPLAPPPSPEPVFSAAPAQKEIYSWLAAHNVSCSSGCDVTQCARGAARTQIIGCVRLCFAGPEGELRGWGDGVPRYCSQGWQTQEVHRTLPAGPAGLLVASGEGWRLRRCWLRHSLAVLEHCRPAVDPVNGGGDCGSGVSGQGLALAGLFSQDSEVLNHPRCRAAQPLPRQIRAS